MKFDQYFNELAILFIFVFIINILQIFLCRKLLLKSVLKNNKEIFTQKFNKNLYIICVISDISCLIFMALCNVAIEYLNYDYAANISFLDMFYFQLLISTSGGLLITNYVTVLFSLVVNMVLGAFIFSKFRELEGKEVFLSALLFTLIVSPYYFLIPFGLIF